MTHDPQTVAEARAELETLRAARARSGRVFYSVVPGLLGGALVVLSWKGPVGAALLGAILCLWAAGTALGLVPAPSPPSRYDTTLERIRFLEGFLAGARDDDATG